MRERVDELVEDISWASAGYSPKDPDVLKSLGETTMACIVGPVAVGKNTVINEVIRADEEFGKVVSFTTRERRAGEDPSTYDFRPHDESTLQSVLEGLRQGSLAQCQVHQNTGRIYGSEKETYFKPFMLLDTLSSAVVDIRNMPFKRTDEITLVARPQQWQERMIQRAAEIESKEEVRSRLEEAAASLDWSLQQGENMSWVVNEDGLAARAARDVIGIVRQTSEPDPKNRDMGEKLQKAVKSLL